MKIKVKVKPNSGKQEVTKISDTEYVVNLKSQPENNKANIELIKLLKKHFAPALRNLGYTEQCKNQPKIVRGHTSRNKIVEIKSLK